MMKQIITFLSLLLSSSVICRHVPDIQTLDQTKMSSFEPCRNYYNQPGVCVNTELCESLPGVNTSNNRWTFWELLILNGHFCGDRHDRDSVCCDINNIITPQPEVVDRFDLGFEPLLPVPGSGDCGFFITDKLARQGTRTKMGEFPWLALLQYTEYKNQNQVYTKCTGVLISKRYVLTSATCITDYERLNVNLKDVRLGDWNLSSSVDCLVQGITRECAEPVQDIGIEKIIVHPEFRRSLDDKKIADANKDIALIRLAKPVKTSVSVSPICLPLSGEDTKNGYSNERKRFTVAGWKNGAFPVKQTDDDVFGVSREKCNDFYGISSNELSSICSLGKPDNDFTDVGGALMSAYNDGRGNNYYYAAGIKSFVNNRQNLPLNSPKHFTRVSTHVYWIRRNITP